MTTDNDNIEDPGGDVSLKSKTAGTLKWNTIDRVSSQILYAVVGVVLANILSKEDYGVVGILLVFQAFATVFVDSGFGAALLQRKDPDAKDYSTVFWFNAVVSLLIYILLFILAPFLGEWFHNSALPAMARVMFLTFIINGLGIVQTNRLMKRMDVKMIAISNTVGLVVSGVVGVWLAMTGYGAWALVWQSVTLATVKTGWLWITGGWLPAEGFHISSLKKIWKIGLGVFTSSFLNTLCLNIYSFVIGAFYSLGALGVYTQADKWSKMGSASMSQVLTATFVPLLARFQDSGEKFTAYVKRVNSFTAFVMFPFMIGLTVAGEPIFHLLFGNKWDEAIPLFQLLTVRGIFVVLVSLYGNYLLALGYAKTLFTVEVVKDVMIFVAILSTVFFESVELLVWGQLGASVVTYFIVLWLTGRHIGYSVRRMLSDLVPYLFAALIMGAIALALSGLTTYPILQLLLEAAVGLGAYWILIRMTGRWEQVKELIR